MLSYKMSSGFSPKAVNKAVREQRRQSDEKKKKSKKKREAPRRSVRERTSSRSEARTRTRVEVDATGFFDVLSSVFDYYRGKKHARNLRNAELDRTVLGLAREHKGLLASRILEDRKICSKEEADASLQRLVFRNRCRYLCEYQNESVYVFSGFVPRVWACDYCDSEFEVGEHHKADDHHDCCNCGASLKFVVGE